MVSLTRHRSEASSIGWPPSTTAPSSGSDAAGHVAPPNEIELAQAAAARRRRRGIAEQRLVNEEDAYYYSRQRRRFEEVVLPVYRVILNDDEQTRYYLDPNTGALLQRADSTDRWRRWLFSGLHRLDFTAWMRSRPFRDIMMWLTLLGGLAVSVTGVYLAIRRVRSDLAILFRVFVKRRAVLNPAPRKTDIIGA